MGSPCRANRRACPAVGKQICAVCCGTKRLVQIQCPPDCVYLTTARDHPPAALVRRQQQDLGLLVHFMRDLNERQSQLFFLATTFLVQYQSPELQPLIDDETGVTSSPVSFGASFLSGARENTLRDVAGPLTLRIVGGSPLVMLCKGSR